MNRRILTTIIPMAMVAAASAQSIVTTVDGKTVQFQGQQPTMVNNRVMVPVRGVFEEMGVHVEWDAAAREVHAHGNGREAKLRINSPYAIVDGQTVELDAPPTIMHGRTLVPLRFISESMGAVVNWYSDTRTVAIDTAAANVNTGGSSAQPMTPFVLSSNTVVPFELNTKLASNTSKVGDRFTAKLDAQGEGDYEGLPAGTTLEGHVATVRAKSGDTPGVLGLEFDRVRLPSGRTYAIEGSLIGLDNNSVENENGRLVAKGGAKDDLKYVGIGAGAGAIIAIATEKNILTSALIGGALGYLYEQIRKGEQKANNVVLENGTRFGVVLNEDLRIGA